MSTEAMKKVIERLRTAMTDARQNESHFESWMILNEAICDSIDDLRQAIEQAKQAQPVAWALNFKLLWPSEYEVISKDGDNAIPLYIAPPQRQPLTPEEIKQCCYDTDCQVADHPQTWKWTEGFARAIEAAHGIKENT